MRTQLAFWINGKPHTVSGQQAFEPLSDYLRYGLCATGTKVVCAEGDCGACTVLVGRLEHGQLVYRPVNGCIQYLYQLDGTHVITVEGLKVNGCLNAVQEAMVANHGAQCGYCTPGFVVALSGWLQQRPCSEPVTPQEIQDALTGNLCRCTGYEPIIRAGLAAASDTLPSVDQLYPPDSFLPALKETATTPVDLTHGDRRFFKPVTLKQALAFRAEHPGCTLIAGGTDISVVCNKRDFTPQTVMSLTALSELNTIQRQGNQLVIGASTPLSELERFIVDQVPELAEFYQMLILYGSPQIRNAGTLTGNIANGSPIGDSLPMLMALEAEVAVASATDGVRRIPITELYIGYRTLSLTPTELITAIHLPLPGPDETLKLYKVSKRKHLDISTFAAALLLTRYPSQPEVIQSLRIAYGGVGPTVVRLPQTEAFLAGKPFTEATLAAAGEIAVGEITPISDVRGHQAFRLQLARNILLKFFHDLHPSEALEAVVR
jgi:xanthine dehydrogenase small subunit